MIESGRVGLYYTKDNTLGIVLRLWLTLKLTDEQG
jgi:hypothetical protein